jgi:hypothetical protein
MIKAKLYNLLSILPLLALLSGCASTYTGLGPNLYVREPGEIAEQKEHFHLASPIFLTGYKLGRNRYSAESVLPIVADVSPDAAKQIVKGSRWSDAGLVLAAAGVFSFTGSSGNHRHIYSLPALIFYSGIGVFAYGNSKIQTGVREYNGKLEETLQMKTDF